MRTILPAALFSLLLPLQANAIDLVETKWAIDREEDGFSDETKVFAGVTAKGGFKKGFIAFGCYPSGFEGKVGTGQYIGDKDVSNNFRYRIDKETPVKTTMKTTSKKYVYFNNANDPFVKALMSGKSKVLIETTNYSYDTSRAEFTLNGSTAAIQAVIDACKGK